MASVTLSSQPTTPVSSPQKQKGASAQQVTPQKVRDLTQVFSSPTTKSHIQNANQTVTPQRRSKIRSGVSALEKMYDDASTQPQKDFADKKVTQVAKSILGAASSFHVDTERGHSDVYAARDLMWYKDDALDPVLKQHKKTPRHVFEEELKNVFVNIDHLTAPTGNGKGWHYVKPGDANAAYITKFAINLDTGVYLGRFQLPTMVKSKFSTFYSSSIANADELTKILRRADFSLSSKLGKSLCKVTESSGKAFYAEYITKFNDIDRYHTLYPLFKVVDATKAVTASLPTVELIKKGENLNDTSYGLSKSPSDLRHDIRDCIKNIGSKKSPIQYFDGSDTFYIDLAWYYKAKNSKFPASQGFLVKSKISDHNTSYDRNMIQSEIAHSGV